MRNVTGQQGLTVDISGQGTTNQLQYRDQNGASGGSGQGVLRIADGPTLFRIDRGGGAFNLTNLRVDIDGGTGRTYVTLPEGPFDITAPDITTAGSFSDPDQTTHYGSLTAKGLNFQTDNTISVGAQSGGFDFDGQFDNPVSIEALRYRDSDGSVGNSGALGLQNIRIEDTRYSVYSFEGAQIHADDEAGVVFAAPVDMNDVGVTADLTINDNTLLNVIAGRSSSGLHFEGSRIQVGGRSDGFELSPFIRVDDIDEIRLQDPDGVGGSGRYLDIETIRAGNIFGVSGVEAAELGTHFVDVDSDRGIVVQAPSRSTSITPLDVSLGGISVDGDYDDMLRADFSNIDYRGSTFALKSGGTNGDGLTLDTDLELTLNEIRIVDPGLNGFFSMGEIGSGVGIRIDDGSGGAASLTGMTVDVDGSRGVVVEAPDGSFSAEVTDAHLGDASTSLGTFQANNLNVGGSKIRVQPH